MPKKKADKKSNKSDDSHQVKVPDAVKKQAEKADALLAGDDPSSPDTDNVIVDNPSDDPPKKEDKPVFTPAPEPVKDNADPLPEDNENWKHKYEVLQGMFNKKDQETKSLVQGMENLQNLVNHQADQIRQINLSAQAPATQEAPGPAAAVPAQEIKKIDLDSVAGYGDEIVYMAEGFNALVDMNQRLLSQIQTGGGQANTDPQRLDRIESMVHETAQGRYFNQLDAEVPKWREVVNTPEFQGWLQGVDPRSGYVWKQMMDFADQNLRAMQAASIIKEFGASTGIDVGTRGSASPPAEMVGDTNIVDQTRDPLAGQAMPNETTGGDQGKAPENYPTSEEVAKASALYAQKRISIDEFNEISNRFQQGLKAARQGG